MIKPEDAGMSSNRLERIRPAVEKSISETKIAGAVTLLARGGEIVHHESFGLMDRESNRAMQNDTIFRIYSMTKPITCTALLMLYEQGLFQLIDPVMNYIPEFGKLNVYETNSKSKSKLIALKRPVTIRDLLTHTSGLTYHFTQYGPVEEMYRKKKLSSFKPLDEFVHELLTLPLCFQPGTRFRYSFAHDVVARLVEVVSGMRFDEFLQKNIFSPLEMHDTGFFVPEQKLPRLASMYGTMDIIQPKATAAALWKNVESAGGNLLGSSSKGVETGEHAICRGGHGLVSTATDYFHFSTMLLNRGRFKERQLLSPKTVELMTANHLLPELLPFEIRNMEQPGYGYGLGVRVLMDVGQAQLLGSPGEFGWSGAANTYFWIDPVEQMIGIILAQFQPNNYYPLSQDFRTTAYQAIVEGR